jgi:hypothetical protein
MYWIQQGAKAGKHEYLCAADVVVHSESLVSHGNSDTLACGGHQTSPSNPYRHEEGRTRWDGLESTVGPDHQKALPAEMLSSRAPRGGVDSARDFTSGHAADKRAFRRTSSRRLQVRNLITL